MFLCHFETVIAYPLIYWIFLKHRRQRALKHYVKPQKWGQGILINRTRTTISKYLRASNEGVRRSRCIWMWNAWHWRACRVCRATVFHFVSHIGTPHPDTNVCWLGQYVGEYLCARARLRAMWCGCDGTRVFCAQRIHVVYVGCIPSNSHTLLTQLLPLKWIRSIIRTPYMSNV